MYFHSITFYTYRNCIFLHDLCDQMTFMSINPQKSFLQRKRTNIKYLFSVEKANKEIEETYSLISWN